MYVPNVGLTGQYEAPAHNSDVVCAQNQNWGLILLLKTLQWEAVLGGRPCSVTLQKRGVFSASGTNQKCSKLHLGIDPRDDNQTTAVVRLELTAGSQFSCGWIVEPTQ